MAQKTNEVWDSKTQSFHGGQDWAHLTNFVCDFSVTTNALGTPQKALDAAINSLQTIEHYPAADFEPALSSLLKWLFNIDGNTTDIGGNNVSELKARFTLGNGASELIDLITRQAPKGSWKPGPTIVGQNPVQYREYERSASADDRKILSPTDTNNEAISAIVNPCNPTGEYMEVEELKKHIETKHAHNSFVLVDESMLPWLGPHWRLHSLTTHLNWIHHMLTSHGKAIWVIHSWTKIWSCPGVRIGSVFAPSVAHMTELKRKQVPWSLNTAAIAFTNEVVKDEHFMKETWRLTSEWRAHTVHHIKSLFPKWKVYGEPWLSWLWIDCGNEQVADEVCLIAKNGGFPIRPGKKGYDCNTFIRLAVRQPVVQDKLFELLKQIKQE